MYRNYIVQYRVVHGGTMHTMAGTIRAYTEAYAMRRGLTVLIENGFTPIEVTATEA